MQLKPAPTWASVVIAVLLVLVIVQALAYQRLAGGTAATKELQERAAAFEQNANQCNTLLAEQGKQLADMADLSEKAAQAAALCLTVQGAKEQQ